MFSGNFFDIFVPSLRYLLWHHLLGIPMSVQHTFDITLTFSIRFISTLSYLLGIFWHLFDMSLTSFSIQLSSFWHISIVFSTWLRYFYGLFDIYITLTLIFYFLYSGTFLTYFGLLTSIWQFYDIFQHLAIIFLTYSIFHIWHLFSISSNIVLTHLRHFSGNLNIFFDIVGIVKIFFLLFGHFLFVLYRL